VGIGSFDVAVVLSVATVITLWLLPSFKRLTKSGKSSKG
jgi:hypothetical protein